MRSRNREQGGRDGRDGNDWMVMMGSGTRRAAPEVTSTTLRYNSLHRGQISLCLSYLLSLSLSVSCVVLLLVAHDLLYKKVGCIVHWTSTETTQAAMISGMQVWLYIAFSRSRALSLSLPIGGTTAAAFAHEQSSSGAARCRIEAPRLWVDSQEHRYRPAQRGHILEQRRTSNGSSRHHWRTSPC
jgi:hypothetical protein